MARYHGQHEHGNTPAAREMATSFFYRAMLPFFGLIMLEAIAWMF